MGRWWCQSDQVAGSAIAAGTAAGGVLAMTRARGVAGGGRWISGRRCAFWRRGRRGCAAAGTASWSPRCRGRGTLAGSRAAFEDQVAWLAVRRQQDRGLGADADRVADGRRDLRAGRRRGQAASVDLLAGLERIGIDEISVRKGQRYLTVVVDHDTGRLVWAAPRPGPQDG